MAKTKTKKYNRKTNIKKNIKKIRSRKNRGRGVEWKTTPITDKEELRKLKKAEENAEKIERRDNEIRRMNAELERQRNNVISGLIGTPMDPKEIKRRQREDELHNKRVNSEQAKSRKLNINDLGLVKN